MRLFPRLLAVAAATATTVAMLAAPAAAMPDPCPNGEPLCLYVNGFSLPIGVPAIFPTGVRPDHIPGPLVCDSSGTNCEQSYVVLGGVVVSGDGWSLGTLNVPGFGIGIDGTTTRLYFSQPTLGGGSGEPLGITVKIYVPLTPFYVPGTSPDCMAYENFDPVTVQTTGEGCVYVVTIAL